LGYFVFIRFYFIQSVRRKAQGPAAARIPLAGFLPYHAAHQTRGHALQPTAFHLRQPPTEDGVSALLDALEAFADEAGIAQGTAMRLALVAEEMAANLVHHGTGASFFELRASVSPDSVGLIFEDDGPAFDPLGGAAVETTASVEEREVGGLGLHLIRIMTRDARHERVNGRNRLVCSLPAAD